MNNSHLTVDQRLYLTFKNVAGYLKGSCKLYMDGKRILVVDDDQDILNIVTYLLETKGYQVQALPNGEEVMQTVKKFHPHLVLMDVMLAGMDGRMICQELKQTEDTRKLPVILISGTHNLSLSLDQQGAPNDFLAKPFDIDVLLEKVEQQLAA